MSLFCCRLGYLFFEVDETKPVDCGAIQGYSTTALKIVKNIFFRKMLATKQSECPRYRVQSFRIFTPYKQRRGDFSFVCRQVRLICHKPRLFMNTLG